MAYSAPSIGTQGLSIPSYNDILTYFVSGVQNIYGSQIYLGADSADYQMLSIIALLAYDCNNGLQLAYNSFGASTASGSSQDALYKINGLTRKVPSYSTCSTVVITGTAGITISNGKVQDTAGNIWDLPTSVTIGAGGTVTVTATCETIGAINAAAGTLTTIATPTYGWTSVINTALAVAGQPVETDSTFRVRQTTSTAIASVSPLNGTEAAIASIEGVTRYIIYENPTASTATDPNGLGLPPHSITAVVEGSVPSTIATAIWDKKTPGCYTNGSTTIDVTDQYGNVTPIGFYVLAYTPIYVTLNVHKLTGYSTAITTDITTALVSYLNSLTIGETVLISALQAVAMTANPNIARPVFSISNIYSGTSISPSFSVDIPINYNYASQGITANIVINFV